MIRIRKPITIYSTTSGEQILYSTYRTTIPNLNLAPLLASVLISTDKKEYEEGIIELLTGEEKITKLLGKEEISENDSHPSERG